MRGKGTEKSPSCLTILNDDVSSCCSKSERMLHTTGRGNEVYSFWLFVFFFGSSFLFLLYNELSLLDWIRLGSLCTGEEKHTNCSLRKKTQRFICCSFNISLLSWWFRLYNDCLHWFEKKNEIFECVCVFVCRACVFLSECTHQKLNVKLSFVFFLSKEEGEILMNYDFKKKFPKFFFLKENRVIVKKQDTDIRQRFFFLFERTYEFSYAKGKRRCARAGQVERVKLERIDART